MNPRKLVLLGVLLALVASAFIFDLGEYLTLERMKQQQAFFSAQVQDNPLRAGGVFFVLYVLLTAVSFPGTLVLTLLAGALFGLVKGTLLVSFASTLGALIAMLVSRYLLRDWVQKRFGQQVASINKGIERDGAFYLFSLRLMPLIPFVLLNPAMGLTQVRFWTYWWTTQAGMLPGNAIYVNAGREIRSLQSVSGILSPTMIGTLILLAIFPLLARKGLDFYKARKVYKPWSRPKRFERNLVVIGAGSGGLVTASIAAALKAKVTLIEKRRPGGDCLYSGCVPSKTLIRSARLTHELRQGERLGLRPGDVQVDFAAVMDRVQRVIAQIEPHDSVERYRSLGVEVIEGEAKVTSPWTVEVDGRTLTARALVLATGSRPRLPAIPGIDAVDPLTSDNVWSLRQCPRRLLVLGGGPVACELAQAFQRLGSQVTLVNRSDTLLKREDVDARNSVIAALIEDGIDLRLAHQAMHFEIAKGERQLICRGPDEEEVTLAFDQVLVALGRVANVEGFGLEALGLAASDNGTLNADECLLTRYPNIYAVGDVAGPFKLTHAASQQAWHATVNALFGSFWRFKASYRVMPWTTFTSPEVAQVGLTESTAREQQVQYEVTRFALSDLDRAIIDDAPGGFVKVLTVPGKDSILGVTIVGERAGELIAEFVLAMKHKLGLKEVLDSVHAYPTLAEANRSVAGRWQRAHASERLLRWAERLHRWQRGRDA